jgi:AraC-like DNA-binding protein
MVHFIHVPRFPLNQFVEAFIYFRDYKPDHDLDRFLPDGNVNVVIDLTEKPKYIHDNHTLKEIQACRRVWFSGIRRAPITIPSGRNSAMFIINFHKGMAYPFVEMPMDELTDLVVDGQLVMTSEILTIRDKILECPDPAKMFVRAEDHLVNVFGKRLVTNPFVVYAVGQIMLQPDQVTMERLARKVGYSGKHMIQLFRNHVGLPPKTFLRIMRFQKTIADIERSGMPDWATIAYESGYYDQAHFINDFKHFSGFTPEQYLLGRRNFKNYVAVA